ncbi:MAG: hypothetical protein H6817_04635 [Phycisphaerales bacterium]|nr:hypothetical protein [Phycisphaerales bacterium]
MPNTKIKELESVVAKLQSERETHVAAIAEIDAAFESMGISPESDTPRRRGRKPGPKPGTKRKKPGPKPGSKRRKKPGPKPKKTKAKGTRKGKGKGDTGKRYAVSGTSMIIDLVKSAGAKGVSGGEIDKKWKKQGRAGGAYTILGQLVKAKKIKKTKVAGQRGSVYLAA